MIRRLIFLIPGLLLQAGAWGPEVRLSNNSTVAETGLNHGGLAISSTGLVTVAWAEQDGVNNNFRIYTRTRNGSTWDPGVLGVNFHDVYTGTSLGAKFPSLVYVPGDTLLMVWHDYRVGGILNCELFTKNRAPGAAWGDSSSEQRLTTSNHPETNGDNSLVPNLTVTPDGSAHVVWYDYRFDGHNSEILFKSRTGGDWDITPGDDPDSNISNNTGDSHFPCMVSAPDGTLHLAWRDNTSGTYQIYYKTRSLGGAWSTTEELSPPAVPATGVALATASDGTVVAVWSDSRSGGAAIYLRERTPVGLWSKPVRVSPLGVGASASAVSVDDSGIRHVAWDDARVSVFNRNIFFQSAAGGASWDSTGASDTRLSIGSGSAIRPTIVSQGENVYVIWQDASHGPTEIYFRASETVVGVPTSKPVLRAFPNPFRSLLTVADLPPDLPRLYLVDVQGRRVARAQNQLGTAKFSASDLPHGIYFLMSPGYPRTLGKVLHLK